MTLPPKVVAGTSKVFVSLSGINISSKPLTIKQSIKPSTYLFSRTAQKRKHKNIKTKLMQMLWRTERLK